MQWERIVQDHVAFTELPAQFWRIKSSLLYGAVSIVTSYLGGTVFDFRPVDKFPLLFLWGFSIRLGNCTDSILKLATSSLFHILR
jgi:hypothetical protein